MYYIREQKKDGILAAVATAGWDYLQMPSSKIWKKKKKFYPPKFLRMISTFEKTQNRKKASKLFT